MNGQEHIITIEAQLDDKNDILQINQSIIYHNTSDSTLNHIFLHNWINGYKNNKSPLARRLIEDYDKSLYFAKQKDRGYSTIKNLTVDNQKNQPELTLPTTLKSPILNLPATEKQKPAII